MSAIIKHMKSPFNCTMQATNAPDNLWFKIQDDNGIRFANWKMYCTLKWACGNLIMPLAAHSTCQISYNHVHLHSQSPTVVALCLQLLPIYHRWTDERLGWMPRKSNSGWRLRVWHLKHYTRLHPPITFCVFLFGPALLERQGRLEFSATPGLLPLERRVNWWSSYCASTQFFAVTAIVWTDATSMTHTSCHSLCTFWVLV